MSLVTLTKLKGIFSLEKIYVSKYLLSSAAFSRTCQHCSQTPQHFQQKCNNAQNILAKYDFARAYSTNLGLDLNKKLHDLELENFNAVREIVHNALVHEENKSLADAINWHSKVFDYNLKGGKLYRGTTVVTAYKVLSNNVTAEGLFHAKVLGWCVEMLQSFFLIADDMMDQSLSRRGIPCWYKNPEVGLIAINDSLLLQCGVYKILRKFFQRNKFYNEIVQEFLQTTEKTAYGQCLDMLSNPPHGKPRYECFNEERYNTIVEYKTSYYTFCLPIHLAMHLIGDKTVEEFEITKNLALKLGLLFQIQDDFLDCYGNPDITGKLGTDIAEGKCSWFAVTFLEIADDSLRKEWVENYGNSNESSVSKVMELYKKLNMFEKYMNFEQKLHSDISHLIREELKSQSIKELFSLLLNKMYKRKK